EEKEISKQGSRSIFIFMKIGSMYSSHCCSFQLLRFGSFCACFVMEKEHARFQVIGAGKPTVGEIKRSFVRSCDEVIPLPCLRADEHQSTYNGKAQPDLNRFSFKR